MIKTLRGKAGRLELGASFWLAVLDQLNQIQKDKRP